MKTFRYVLLLLGIWGGGSLSTLCNAEPEKIPIAWYHWNPYQYLDSHGKLVGLDVALVQAIFHSAQLEVVYDENANDNWKKNQDDVFHGRRLIAAGAFATPDRKEKYHLTRPYRYEWNSLYLRAEDKSKINARYIEEIIDRVSEGRIKLGVVTGYKYTSEALNDFISTSLAAQDGHVVVSSTDEQSFSKLRRGEVDVIASDRLVGARILWEKNFGEWVVESPIKLPALPIHILVHKSSDPEKDKAMRAIVEAFDRELDRLTSLGVRDEIIGHYLFPVLMNISVQRDWFYFIDLLGAVFFALAGLMIAKDKGYDIFGTLVMVGLLATGGGIMRDVLVGRVPAVLRSPDYIYIVTVVTFAGFLFLQLHSALCRFYNRYAMWSQNPKLWLLTRQLIEAIALGAYTIIGVGVAVEMKVDPLWLWGPLLGCLTSCGGGVVALALRNDDNAMQFRGGVDPECSLIWGAIFSAFLIWQTDRLNPEEVVWGVMITLLGVTLSVMVLARYQIRSPILRLK